MVVKHDYVTIGEQEYLISTAKVYNKVLETMVFKSKNHCVLEWNDLYVRQYDDMEEALEGHKFVVENLEKCLNEEEE